MEQVLSRRDTAASPRTKQPAATVLALGLQGSAVAKGHSRESGHQGFASRLLICELGDLGCLPFLSLSLLIYKRSWTGTWGDDTRDGRVGVEF